MKILNKAAWLAASAATLIAAAPADARDRYGDRYGYRDGIDAGDVIAGALIIGGIAAIASAGSRDRYGNGRSYDRGSRYGYGGGDYGYYNNGYGSRSAVDQCVQVARRDAGRFGWARVTDISSIERIRGGYVVRGRLVVETRGRGYDRGYHYDRYDDGYDKGRFSCVTRYGGVEDLRLAGLRGGYYR